MIQWELDRDRPQAGSGGSRGQRVRGLLLSRPQGLGQGSAEFFGRRRDTQCWALGDSYQSSHKHYVVRVALATKLSDGPERLWDPWVPVQAGAPLHVLLLLTLLHVSAVNFLQGLRTLSMCSSVLPVNFPADEIWGKSLSSPILRCPM